MVVRCSLAFKTKGEYCVVQVLCSDGSDGDTTECLAANLPDDLPGQSNCGAADAAEASFVSATASHSMLLSSPFASAALTVSSPCFQPATQQQRSLRAHQQQRHLQGSDDGSSQQHRCSGKAPRSPLNEVVCGTMMLALERGGQADKVTSSATPPVPTSIAGPPVILYRRLSCTIGGEPIGSARVYLPS